MTDPITLDLAGIRARAQAVGPLSWKTHGRYVAMWNDRGPVCDVAKCNDAHAAAFIADMDPPTTLALVDEVERLTEAAIDFEEKAKYWYNMALQLMVQRDEARELASLGEQERDQALEKLRTLTRERDDAHAGNWGFLQVTDEIVRRVGLGFSQKSGMTWTAEGIRNGLENVTLAAPADKVQAFEKLEAERARAKAAEAEAVKLRARVAELEGAEAGWKRVAVTAVIPLEALNMAGTMSKHAPELQVGIRDGISAVRKAILGEGFPADKHESNCS